MNIVSRLWSALNALVASIHALAATLNETNAELRNRIGLEDGVARLAGDPPDLAHALDRLHTGLPACVDGATNQPTETPTPVPSANGRRGKRQAAVAG